MKVVIVGGGIGGLALASGLRGRGIDVVVLERDGDPAETGGYHITLQQRVQQALRQLVRPRYWECLLASAADGRLRDNDVLWDSHGRLVRQMSLKGVDPGIDIDRVTLRLILADAVGEDLRLGSRVMSYRAGGRPSVVLDTGEVVVGDVLVAADGAHSSIAADLNGGPTNTPAGIVGVSGRTRVADLAPGVAARLGVRSSLGIGRSGSALYLGYLDPVGHAVLNLPERSVSRTKEPSFIWGAMFPDRLHGVFAVLQGEELRDAVIGAFQNSGWGPLLLDVVGRTDPASVAAFRFNAAATDPKLLAKWPAGSVTALGDAVHATPPTAGMGAGAAILDAEDLADALSDANEGTTTVAVAIRDYQQRTRERGAAVVAAAMETVRFIRLTDSPIGAPLTASLLPVLAGVRGVATRVRPD